jgi:uncharacterized membrane protein YtjA (UPF0391 family)
MLRAAIAFFVIGLLALLFGAMGLAGVSLEIGQSILGIFVFLAVMSFVISLLSNKKATRDLR